MMSSRTPTAIRSTNREDSLVSRVVRYLRPAPIQWRLVESAEPAMVAYSRDVAIATITFDPRSGFALQSSDGEDLGHYLQLGEAQMMCETVLR